MNSPEKYNRENVPKTVVEDCNVKSLILQKYNLYQTLF